MRLVDRNRCKLKILETFRGEEKKALVLWEK